MKWINIVGLCLQFLAFWLAAPELLGAEALKRFEQGLIKLVSTLPNILIAGTAICFGGIMAYYGVSKGIEASQGSSESVISTMIIIIIASIAVMVYMIFFAKKSQDWISRKYATPLMNTLINNNSARKASLITGAILFTCGFFLQFIAALLS
ncbi:hypothetical protein GYB22_11410 [bacterium]|nr:hypothetical protein [bacterium]